MTYIFIVEMCYPLNLKLLLPLLIDSIHLAKQYKLCYILTCNTYNATVVGYLLAQIYLRYFSLLFNLKQNGQCYIIDNLPYPNSAQKNWSSILNQDYW